MQNLESNTSVKNIVKVNFFDLYPSVMYQIISMYYKIKNSISRTQKTGQCNWIIYSSRDKQIPPNNLQPSGVEYEQISDQQLACQLNSAKMYTAAVGVAWLLLGSPCKGQAALYIFQKHLFLASKPTGSVILGDVCETKRKSFIAHALCFPYYQLASSATITISSFKDQWHSQFFPPPVTVIIMAAPNRNYEIYVFPCTWSNNLKYLKGHKIITFI